MDLKSSRCSGKAKPVNQWVIKGWDAGSNCRKKCLEQAKESSDGCCEARVKRKNSMIDSTDCFYKTNSELIDESAWEGKAVLCEGI